MAGKNLETVLWELENEAYIKEEVSFWLCGKFHVLVWKANMIDRENEIGEMRSPRSFLSVSSSDSGHRRNRSFEVSV